MIDEDEHDEIERRIRAEREDQIEMDIEDGREEIESEVEDELDKEVAADLEALSFNLNLNPVQE
jgi:hypothetical protein